ncbi:MAG: tetratricopeptide repeat protein [Acidobacteriota bacterium]|nr:tetratricopeptide repeat protein [Acidobacteriota bacterium]
MYCQACGALNRDEEEFCVRCHQKLLVLSGLAADEDRGFDAEGEESFSFDEHLLERISILEEAVKRTAETVRLAMTAITKQERSILVNQTGLATLRDLLEDKQLLAHDEWSSRWEETMDYQVLALEKRQRFLDLKERMVALFAGRKRKLFEQLLDDAEYALFAFDVERALSALETAFKLDRDNYELAYFIGEIYFNDGEPERALPYFIQVLRVAPDHYEGLVFSGVIRHERGETPEAEKLLKRAVALHPDSFLPNFSLGAIYASRGNLTRATALLEKATRIESVPEALFLLGSCLYEMGQASRAIQRLEAVVRLDPSHEEGHHLLGLAYLDRGWNRKALASFRQAQSLNPKKLRYQDLVRYLSGQGSSPLPRVGEEAARWLEQAESVRLENTDRALTFYRRALNADPDNPTLLISFALACLEMKKSRETEALTRRVLELEPEEMLKATACATLIEALRVEGRFREGNRIGTRLLEESTTSFSRTIAYYEMAFNLAEMEEDLDRALEFAHQSLSLSPEELKQFPLAAIGWVHFKRQELDKAVDFLSQSSDLDPSATTLTHLGMALLAAGEDSRAKTVLARARQSEVHAASVQQRMMDCMKDTSRLLERVRERERK